MVDVDSTVGYISYCDYYFTNAIMEIMKRMRIEEKQDDSNHTNINRILDNSYNCMLSNYEQNSTRQFFTIYVVRYLHHSFVCVFCL